MKALLIGAVSVCNLVGARAGARVNDVLTVAKLLPLAVLIFAGIAFIVVRPAGAGENLLPFAPWGWSGFGASVLVIFWAYAGFELVVLPAGEVRQARRTLPRGLILGMIIATFFYLLTASAAVVALPSSVMAESKRSLADALESILGAFGMVGGFGGWVMSLGALVSIAGVYEATADVCDHFDAPAVKRYCWSLALTLGCRRLDLLAHSLSQKPNAPPLQADRRRPRPWIRRRRAWFPR